MTTLFFSTVVRAAPLLDGGELVRLDWECKEVRARAPLAPLNMALRDQNPRGNCRGGRGIWLTADSVFVATYDGVRSFDHALNPKGDVSNSLLVDLHEVTMTAPGQLG